MVGRDIAPVQDSHRFGLRDGTEGQTECRGDGNCSIACDIMRKQEKQHCQTGLRVTTG